MGEKFITKPKGLVIESVNDRDLTLKLYDISKNNREKSFEFIVGVKDFLRGEISQGKVDPQSGYGFSTLLDQRLKVYTWGKNLPGILLAKIYGFNVEDLRSFKELATDEFRRTEGEYYPSEMPVVRFENEAWKAYLSSDRAEEDLREYLDTFSHTD